MGMTTLCTKIRWIGILFAAILLACCGSATLIEKDGSNQGDSGDGFKRNDSAVLDVSSGETDGGATDDLTVDLIETEGNHDVNTVEDGDLLSDGHEDVTEYPPGSVDYVIVAADPLADAAEAFAAYREQMGQHVKWISMGSLLSPHPPEKWKDEALSYVDEWIKARYDERIKERVFHVLLLGDYVEGSQSSPEDVKATVPAFYHSMAKEFPLIGFYETSGYSDNPYADVDNDDIPEMAIGRIPVSTGEEALKILDKVKNYESEYTVGLWNRRFNALAGPLESVEMMNDMVEQVALRGFNAVSYDFDITMTYGLETSDYYYTPFIDKMVERINEGSIIVLYLGHGWEQGIFAFDVGDVDLIQCENRKPLFFIFACDAGYFTASSDCLAEAVLKRVEGPPMVVAASGSSDTVGNGLMAFELNYQLFNRSFSTIGEAFMLLKRDVIYREDDLKKEYVDAIKMFIGEESYEELILYHNVLYQLFGDPGLIVRFPSRDVMITVTPEKPKAGSTISVSLDASITGDSTAYVTLETSRDVIHQKLDSVPDSSPEKEAVIQSNYEKANNKIITESSVTSNSGHFETTIPLPADLPQGDYYIKAYIRNDAFDVIGSTGLHVTANP